MAETFLAVQRGAAGFEQRVCMKFILPAHRENPDFKRLFLREASIAASLRHSNIVGVIDVDEVAGYLVLELVDGVDLRALLNAAPNHRLPAEMATLITIELCKALAYAHGRKRKGLPDGIVHRDVSASNVLISYAGEVKLTDFGVARAMRADAEPLSTTVKGKLCYMSPEQARGLVLDGRSDLFSLGVLCYELLSGQRPFDGATDADTLLRITAGQHTPLIDLAPDVPVDLAREVERLLCRDREQRFVSADACIDALARFAPKATVFRELGDLARATRPHQTLPGYELLPLERTLLSAPKSNTSTETEHLPDGQPVAPRTSPLFGGGAVQGRDSSAAGFLRALRHVNRNAWSALGVALLLLLAVASAWTARLASEPMPAPTTPHPIPVMKTRVDAPPRSPPGADGRTRPLPGATAVVDTRIGAAPPSTAVALPNTPKGDPPPEDSPVVESKRQPVSESRAAARPGHAEEGEAMLHIGVVPVGQVWIDGHPAGWTPVDAKLSPGPHNIAAGDTQPEVHRFVRMRTGESRQLVLHLDEPRGVGATPQLADR
jgi:serine/threonine protein kinase